MKLLTQNSKLKKTSLITGKKTLDFALPAISTCPMAGKCKKYCYANKGAYLWPNVKAKHEIVHGSIDNCMGDQPYDFVCANIIKSTILDMLDDLKSLTTHGGTLVLAGLLEQDVAEVSEKLMKIDLEDLDVIEDNEWRTIVIRKV